MSARLPQFQVWVHAMTGDHQEKKDQIIRWLNEKGINCKPVISNNSQLGVLLLNQDTIDESSLAEIKSLLVGNSHIIIVDTSWSGLQYYKVQELFNCGIHDVIHWKHQEKISDHILGLLQRWTIIEKMLESDVVKKNLIGSSKIWEKTLRQIIEVACFSCATVLIQGETGTGKELVARLIHNLDRRPGKEELILLDCSTLVPELSGSEFFGHEKGAYTNAVSIRDGAFALANKGTLFLDEIGELPFNMQASLLRVIQEGTYKRLGSNQWRKTEFRLVSATNKNLEQMVGEKMFREDLYYRINTCIVRLPTLQERKNDIPELAEFFLKQILKENPAPILSKSLLNILFLNEFKGNIRELRQLITRIANRYRGGGIITLGCLPPSELQSIFQQQEKGVSNSFKEAIRYALAKGHGLKEIKRMAGDVAMEIAVNQANDHLPTAAQQLGVSERLVQGWCREKKT